MNTEPPNKIKLDPLAIISLVLALVSFVEGPLAAIPAIICARISLNRIKKSETLEGDSYAIAAMVIGYVCLFFYIIVILIGLKCFGSFSMHDCHMTLPH